ncbi:MAG: hypothetical protein K6F32_01280 [Bacilli bacterium]|nr:hypothetical protein [Bacilli bacterium]
MANKSAAISYVGRGFSLARDYYKGNVGRRIAGSLLLLVRLLTFPFAIFRPLFAQSDFSFTRMLHETGDANIAKSFDGVEDTRSYFGAYLFAVVMRLAMLSWTALIGGALYGIYIAFMGMFPSPVVATIYFVLVCVILGVLYLAVMVPMFSIYQAGLHVAAANKALGMGDIAYNGFRAARENGAGITCLVIVNFLLVVLMIAPYPVAAYIFLMMGYGNPETVLAFAVARLALYIVAGFIFLFFGGQVAHSVTFGMNAMLFDRYTPQAYVVSYAERKRGKKTPELGKMIEIMPLEDYETHPLSTHEIQKED